jgi:hypothetical protein
MSSIYLIDLTRNAIVGKFASVTDAEIAAELLLGTAPYYVGDAETLGTNTWSKADLLKLLAALGKEIPEGKVKYTAKPEILKLIVDIAEQTDFAPITPAEAPKPEKGPKAPRAKVGIKTLLREALEAGKSVKMEDFPDTTKVSFTTAISDLRSAKYCGKDLSPLTIIREGDAYRLA